jgi:hypothetical protein
MKTIRRGEAADAKQAVDGALRLAIGDDEAEPFQLRSE